MKFENTFIHLPSRFYSKQSPVPVEDPKLVAWNAALATDLGWEGEPSVEAFSGNELLPGSEPIALVYAGHQFGHFVPRLGDGRAILLGEILTQNGLRFDLQLKGSGVTLYSRNGDGRSPLGPALREYIISEAMYSLGVPTTRSLAVVETGEWVQREDPLKGGIVTRVAKSHIRVGTFEYFAARGDQEGLDILLDYSIRRHDPDLEGLSDRAHRFVKRVSERQARLVAQWMALGFIHGVMNTDNMLVSGETIDFGPCAFMDAFHPFQVFSSIDHQGRYAYGNQPNIAKWNLQRLAESLLPFESVPDAVGEYDSTFRDYYLKIMLSKIGIENPRREDFILLQEFLKNLEKEKKDYTLSFRKLSSALTLTGVAETDWFKLWRERLLCEGRAIDLIQKTMNQVNPAYIPRNHLVEKALVDAYQGDYALFNELNEILKNPFDEKVGKERFAEPPQPNEVVTETFCGT